MSRGISVFSGKPISLIAGVPSSGFFFFFFHQNRINENIRTAAMNKKSCSGQPVHNGIPALFKRRGRNRNRCLSFYDLHIFCLPFCSHYSDRHNLPFKILAGRISFFLVTIQNPGYFAASIAARYSSTRSLPTASRTIS